MTEAWLDKFLRRQYLVAHEDGTCTRIQLLHLGGQRMGVRNLPTPDGGIAESDIDRLAHEILDAAQHDSDSRHGRQKYALSAYYQRAPSVIAESCVFWRDGGGDSEDESADVESEGPNKHGLQAMLMRHTEALSRTVVMASSDVIEAQKCVITALTARTSQMEEGYLRTLQMCERMTTEHYVRELAQKEHDLKTKVFSEAVDKIGLLIPVIVNKLAGVRILPESTTPQNEMIGSFVETLTNDQINRLGEVLTPDQQTTVLNLIQARRAQLEKAQAESAARQAQLIAGTGGPIAGNGSKEAP